MFVDDGLRVEIAEDGTRSYLLDHGTRVMLGQPHTAHPELEGPPAEPPVEGVPMMLSYGDITPNIPNGARCYGCGGENHNGNADRQMFIPCDCADRYWHRECFVKWRAGWASPRNYWACPNCMYSYQMETIGDVDVDTTERMQSNYRRRIAVMWLSILLFIFTVTAFVAVVAWALDPEKNVPIACKFMMTSVVSGVPNSDTTAEWREDFKRPDTRVWPYYTLLGCFICAIVCIILFLIFPVDDDKRKRRSHDTCGQIYCVDAGCCMTWDAPCSCGDSGGVCCSGGCDEGCDGGDTEGCGCGCWEWSCEFTIVIVILVIIAVLVGGVFVVIVWAIRKGAQHHDQFWRMLRSQGEELAGATIVLGKGELMRPQDAV